MTWRERIAEARARGHFTAEDKREAHSYGTCAVAEQRWKGIEISIDQYGLGIPQDSALRELGGDFFWKAVNIDDLDEAERLLDAIEDRALQLKREAGSSNAPASERSEAS